MYHIISIALGGSAGAVSRYLLSKYANHLAGTMFPWGTLTVNLLGCFLIGICIEFFEELLVPAPVRSFLTIGFLGAFTTFSTFSLETVQLLRENEFKLFFWNLILNNGLGVVLVLLGMITAVTLGKTFR